MKSKLVLMVCAITVLAVGLGLGKANDQPTHKEYTEPTEFEVPVGFI